MRKDTSKDPFFIAEIGINHNGDIELAKKLITIAHECKCDAIKFQKRDIDAVYSKEFLDSYRESPWGNTQRDQKNGLEFSIDEYKEIDKFCKKLSIEWFFSCWDIKSQILMREFNTKYNKVASPMITYKDLLKEIAFEGKHTFISTGMSTYKDIDQAIKIFDEANCSFELMHCVSTYPMNEEDANLFMINELRKKYNCNVGYSGHETGTAISIAAAALGATSIERHITIDRAMYGSDQASSIDSFSLKYVVGAVKKIPKALGDGKKRFLEGEKVIAKKLREHIPN